MPTEFDDSQDFAFFLRGDRTLRNGNGYANRWSEQVVASLRASGIFDNMEDGTEPPADKTKLWLDKNFDPPILKVWETAGTSYWRKVTFSDFFGKYDPLNTVKLNIEADGVADTFALDTAGPSVANGYVYVDVYLGGVLQPKDGVSYVLTLGGAAVQFSEVPPLGMRIYIEGVANFYEAVSAAAASLIPNDSDTPGDFVAESLDRIYTPAVWSEETRRTLRERARDRYCLLDAPGGPDPTGSNDNTSSIRAMVAEGIECEVPKGSFVLTGEVEIKTRNQLIRGQGMGQGYGNGGMLDFVPNSRIVVAGTGAKRIRTRRLFRASGSDPQDAPLSVALNVQAANFQMRDICLWLNCDYSDTSPTNLGDDWDVLLFSGTRLGMQLHNVALLGYARQAGLLIDVTQGSLMPRYNDLAGNPYSNEYVKHGSDGIHLFNPYIRGGRRGIAIMGAKAKPGQTTYTDQYYDELSATLYTDNRGGFGCSDFAVFGGSIYGPEHHSGRRLKDPVLDGGVLTQAGMLSEPDDAPAALHIDGLAGNGIDGVWGHRLFGVRIHTRDAFRIRLGNAGRFLAVGSHSDVSSGTTATGAALTTTDYVSSSYGDVAGTSKSVRVGWVGSVQTSRAGLFPHFYGSQPWMITDQGTFSTNMMAEIDGGVRAVTAELDLRGVSGSGVRVRSGSATTAFFDPAGVYDTTTATAANMVITSGNTLQRSTSSGRYKTDVEDLLPEYRDVIMEMRPVWYRSLCEADNHDWSYYGLIAEEVALLDPRLVHWRTTEARFETSLNEAGEQEQYEVTVQLETPQVEGVMYDRLVVHLIAKIQQMEARLAALEGGAA